MIDSCDTLPKVQSALKEEHISEHDAFSILSKYLTESSTSSSSSTVQHDLVMVVLALASSPEEVEIANGFQSDIVTIPVGTDDIVEDKAEEEAPDVEEKVEEITPTTETESADTETKEKAKKRKREEKKKSKKSKKKSKR